MRSALRPFVVTSFILFVSLFYASAGVVRAQVSDGGNVIEQTPSGALWRAAVVPGWGQIYNQQYLKLPFVYGAMGGLLYAAISINDDYKLYRDAFLYKAYQEQVDAEIIETNPYLDRLPAYDRLAARFGPVSSGPLRAQRDTFRRNRDLSYVGMGLIYALSVLDAYVSAHLLDFNVDENLAFRVQPAVSGLSIRARFMIR